jgi:hypothetical protein
MTFLAALDLILTAARSGWPSDELCGGERRLRPHEDERPLTGSTSFSSGSRRRLCPTRRPSPVPLAGSLLVCDGPVVHARLRAVVVGFHDRLSIVSGGLPHTTVRPFDASEAFPFCLRAERRPLGHDLGDQRAPGRSRRAASLNESAPRLLRHVAHSSTPAARQPSPRWRAAPFAPLFRARCARRGVSGRRRVSSPLSWSRAHP